ncbi:hypothetical protein [Streptacidiphilus sp. MAP12-16]|uniref:hypothetical protein n=1 Tax=Streptacidiphilus sp. MAP12-16 TaxID=3156300 RepID=UPI003518EC2B
MRLADGRTHQRRELRPARGSLLRSCVHLTCDGGTVAATDLRVLLVGDVLVRAFEAEGVQVLHSAAIPELPPEQIKTLDRAVTVLGIHPPEADPGAVAQVHVFGGARRDAESGLWVEVGPVREESVPLPVLHEEDGRETEPLAFRLALLSTPYQEPVRLTASELADAERTLRDWRRRTAVWALAPSRPVPAEIHGRLRAALAEDLGTVALLAVLRGVGADPGVPDGAKFETFAYADRFLGLELAREIGQG